MKMKVERIQKREPELHDWSAESGEAIVPKLLFLLEGRLAHAQGESALRAEQLKGAIENLPGKLNEILSVVRDTFSKLRVVSYDIYLTGGFAREMSDEKIDGDTNMDTRIRPDTDIDVLFAYTPGPVPVSRSKVVLALAPVLSTWKESEHIKGVVEVGFENALVPSATHASKPKILLRHIELPVILVSSSNENRS